MITIGLLGLNLVISLFAFAAFARRNNPDRFLFVPAQVARGENLTGMVLSQFSHADLGHFLFNMMTLYFFGPVLEYGLGEWEFLVVYVLAGAGSTLFVYLFKKNVPTYKSLGASGSISGVIFASIVVDPTINIYFFFVPVPIPGPVFAIGYLALSTYLMRRQTGRISHEAHIGGALAGFLLAGVLSSHGFNSLIDRVRDLIS
jgi:membrane associated rhomboid family serine protease